MTIVAVLVLTVLAFAAIAAPFFQQKRRDFWMVIGGSAPDSISRRPIGNVMQKQLERDYQSGILSEEDFRSQQGTLAGPVTAPANSGQTPTLDDDIEMKIAGMRAGKNASVSDDIEERIRQLRRKQPAAAGSQTASGTGSAKKKKARFCPQCGAMLQPGGNFCTQCGEKLT